MAKCKKCGRPLVTGEKNLCPACLSTQSRNKKTWIEIIFSIVGVILFIIGAIFKVLGSSSPKK